MAESGIAFGGDPPVLTLDVKRRLFPDETNFVDRNTLAVNVSVLAGRFRGFIETHVRTDELARFGEMLGGMYKQLHGEWHHEFLGSGLEFRIKGDGLGHFHMVCVADDQGGIGNALTFAIDFDQTDIPKIMQSLDEVLSKFPVRPD